MHKATVSFCISTYNRPVLLQKQLQLLATQTYTGFEVVVSDNDPARSAEAVVTGMHDPRFRYFANETNLGMVKSFNKSIERSQGEFIIMVTDDDPVQSNMLQEMLKLVAEHPGYPLYCGCERAHKSPGEIEVYNENEFLFQLLHPGLTPNFLWSSCLIKRDVALKAGGMPDYGSPHLADHAMLGLVSKEGGGVFVNAMYSQLFIHDKNFSKSNYGLYYTGCQEFYRLITSNFKPAVYRKGDDDALMAHLKHWFIASSFSLRKYFTYQNRNKTSVKDVADNSRKILALPFMRRFSVKYYAKLLVFYGKMPYNNWVKAFKKEKSYI